MHQLRKEVVLSDSTLVCVLCFAFLLWWTQKFIYLRVELSWYPVVLHQLRMELVLMNSILLRLFILFLYGIRLGMQSKFLNVEAYV